MTSLECSSYTSNYLFPPVLSFQRGRHQRTWNQRKLLVETSTFNVSQKHGADPVLRWKLLSPTIPTFQDRTVCKPCEIFKKCMVYLYCILDEDLGGGVHESWNKAAKSMSEKLCCTSICCPKFDWKSYPRPKEFMFGDPTGIKVSYGMVYGLQMSIRIPRWSNGACFCPNASAAPQVTVLLAHI